MMRLLANARALIESDGVATKCASARRFEFSGELSKALLSLGTLWRGVGERPDLHGLDKPTAAELLLRTGSLSSLLGKCHHIPYSQEKAKDLLSESGRLFCETGRYDGQAEAQIALAFCYWCEGASAEARDMLADAMERAELADGDVRALGFLRLAIADMTFGCYEEAQKVLEENRDVFLRSTIPILRARFHNELGLVHYYFLTERQRTGVATCAIREFEAAGHQFAACELWSEYALSENNTALTLLHLTRYREAEERIDRALRVSVELNDLHCLAVARESKARILISQGMFSAAESVIVENIAALKPSDNLALVAESLTTYGIVLCRLNKKHEALSVLEHAIRVAEQAGDVMGRRRASDVLKQEMTANIINLAEARQRRRRFFSWRMPDNSLQEAGVVKGDAVTFTRTSKWADNDLVAVQTPVGKFVKFIYREARNGIRLEGAHPGCPPRRFKESEVKVLGVAITHLCS